MNYAANIGIRKGITIKNVVNNRIMASRCCRSKPYCAVTRAESTDAAAWCLTTGYVILVIAVGHKDIRQSVV